MDAVNALRQLARAMGVRTEYVDGLQRPVTPPPDTLLRICAALGAPLAHPDEAADALRAIETMRAERRLAPVLVAWDGQLPVVPIRADGPIDAVVHCADGGRLPLERDYAGLRCVHGIPWGTHQLVLEQGGRQDTATIISAPVQAWHRPASRPGWGVGTQLAALRSRRSRHVGDLRDLDTLGRWIAAHGGNLVTVLPLLPTFNDRPSPEPSPYSPVSRLFWSELVLDLGVAHRAVGEVLRLDVTAAAAEVREALRTLPQPDLSRADPELVRYAHYRGAQARYGRNWRDWPAAARAGTLTADDVDHDVVRFHIAVQLLAREQLGALRERLDAVGVRIGLDFAVGVHPDGYDPWSRPALFCEGMSVGAPPDPGFPSGQDWGFLPMLPAASQQDGHRYVAAAIAHQASLAGVLRVDHVMALARLYWIPHGCRLHEGTYVQYPAEELFAVLSLASHLHRAEIVGENLGTVPPEIGEAMQRHRMHGMYVAMFAAGSEAGVPEPGAQDVAMIGTHDTPTFAGWLTGVDIADRVKAGLLDPADEPGARAARHQAVHRLAGHVGASPDEPRTFLEKLLAWLGRSPTPLVIPWLEDFWLEPAGVNLPGTSAADRPNWQRPMRRLLDDVLDDPDVAALARVLAEARRGA
jgi:4-alpha-glucanotransferase